MIPSFLCEQLLEKLFENVVGHDPGKGIDLALAMNYGGGGLVDAIGLAERVVFVNGGVERVAFDKRANLGHFRGGEHGGHRAVHVAVLFPLFLILEQGLLHGLTLAEDRKSTRLNSSHSQISY